MPPECFIFYGERFYFLSRTIPPAERPLHGKQKVTYVITSMSVTPGYWPENILAIMQVSRRFERREWPEVSWKSVTELAEFNPAYDPDQWKHYRLSAGRK